MIKFKINKIYSNKLEGTYKGLFKVIVNKFEKSEVNENFLMNYFSWNEKIQVGVYQINED